MRIEARIAQLEKQHGGLRAAAKAVGIDKGYLCRLKRGEKTFPSDSTLKKLGLSRVIDYKIFTQG